MRNIVFAAYVCMILISAGCSETDIQVINIENGSITGRIKASSAKYRDEIIGLDDNLGKIAIITSDELKSTLKIISVNPWNVSERTINFGRKNGFIGLKCFDFSEERIIYCSGKNSLGIITKNGEKQIYELPTMKANYEMSGFVIGADALYIESSKPQGDCEASYIYRFTIDTNHLEEIYHSNGRIFCKSISDNTMRLLEENSGGNKNLRVTTIDLETLKTMEHPIVRIDTSMHEYFLNNDYLFMVAKQSKSIRRVSLKEPYERLNCSFEKPFEHGIYELCGKDDYGLLRLQNKQSGKTTLLAVNILTGTSKIIDDIRGYYHHLHMMKFKNKYYAIISE